MKRNRFTALLLAGLLVLNLLTPLARADEDRVFHVTDTADWTELVRLCRLDSWSDGVTVLVEADITLPKNASIPTFGGTFDGQGHTLRHLDLDGEGDHQGLFRYIREGAVVENIVLTGAVAPSGRSACVGGIVGSNSGTVQGCRVLGAVSGTDSVGGVAGLNTVTGVIRDCIADSGAVSGQHYTGGIVGQNQGAVIGCTNRAQINTQAVEPVPDLEIDWERINRMENFPTTTDTGGVAGYSGGLLQSCANRGTVGYPHVGYNVGGIAGRQMGQLLDCENQGQVLGRKDVGGIVGQAEPYTELNYQEDTLKKLARELDTLSGLMNGALDSTDATRAALSSHLSTITDHTGNAKEDVSDLLDEIEAVGDETVDVANDLSGRVKAFSEELEDATGEMKKASDRLGDGLDDLRSAALHGGVANAQLKQAMADMERGLTALNEVLKEVLDRLSEDLPENGETGEGKALPDWPPMGDPGSMNLEDIKNLLKKLEPALDVITQNKAVIEKAMADMQNSLSAMQGVSDQVAPILSDMALAMGSLESSSRRMEAAFGTLEDALADQNRLPTLELPKLSPEFHETESALRDTMTALNDEMEAMNQTANSGGDDLSGHLKGINRQFNAVTDVLRHAGDEFDDPDLVVDVSDKALEEVSAGRVQLCRNEGSVEGDVNVGGVVGAMAIELDFDPEDDVRETGDRSMRFQYLTRAVVHSCENRGAVTGKKDGVGGIVGRMDLGLVVAAQSYGPVESTAGEEVGGIAGRSDGFIRDSWAKCSLSGERKIGGIAGSGMDISGCRTLVDIRGGASCVGAIAGEADGLVTGNVFLSNSLGGVDGISYDGKAKPVGWEEFQQISGIPKEFTALTVRFFIDGQPIRTLEAAFGQALPEEDIPAVPMRECCYGAWEDFDRTHVTFDRDVHAVYSPWMTTLAGGEGAILAEGGFSPEASLTVEPLAELPEVEGRRVAAGYSLNLNADRGEITALRVKLPETLRDGELWTREAGVWKALPTTLESSYLRAEWSGDGEVLVVSRAVNPLILVLLLAALALVIWLIVRLIHRKKKQKPTK